MQMKIFHITPAKILKMNLKKFEVFDNFKVKN